MFFFFLISYCFYFFFLSVCLSVCLSVACLFFATSQRCALLMIDDSTDRVLRAGTFYTYASARPVKRTARRDYTAAAGEALQSGSRRRPYEKKKMEKKKNIIRHESARAHTCTNTRATISDDNAAAAAVADARTTHRDEIFV